MQRGPCRRHREDAPVQLIDPLAASRHQRQHRNGAQTCGEPRNVDLDAAGFSLIQHVEHQDQRHAHLQYLHGQVKVAFEIGGIDDVDDHLGACFNKEVPCDLFLHRIGRKAVRSRQIDDRDAQVFVGMPDQAGAFLDGFAGPVANMLIGAGQCVEDRALADVGIASKGKRDVVHGGARVTPLRRGSCLPCRDQAPAASRAPPAATARRDRAALRSEHRGSTPAP